MNLDDAREMAEVLMSQHLPETSWCGNDWIFRFDDGIRRFGCCDWGKREIRLSRRLTLANGEREVRLTLLHEIAHALAGPTERHSAVWRRICIDIGGDGKRCWTAEDQGGAVVRVPRVQKFTFKSDGLGLNEGGMG